jgi:phosphate-selective porin OprO/OprP
VRYKSRPESHLAPVVIDTGDLDAEKAAVVDLEVAWVKGPLSIQGEFLNALVDEAGGSPLHFHGFYGYLSWFLTGESRPYNRESATFTRLYPRRNFSFRKGGLGAWEIAGRVSHTDLNDGNISGGRMTLLTGGVTWYPHSHIRWKFNYIHGQVRGRQPAGNLNIFETRVEVDF